jgi:hypothetical protein
LGELCAALSLKNQGSWGVVQKPVLPLQLGLPVDFRPHPFGIKGVTAANRFKDESQKLGYRLDHVLLLVKLNTFIAQETKPMFANSSFDFFAKITSTDLHCLIFDFVFSRLLMKLLLPVLGCPAVHSTDPLVWTPPTHWCG